MGEKKYYSYCMWINKYASELNVLDDVSDRPRMIDIRRLCQLRRDDKEITVVDAVCALNKVQRTAARNFFFTSKLGRDPAVIAPSLRQHQFLMMEVK